MNKFYTIRRRLGGRYVEEIISADSMEGARVLADSAGGEVVGLLFDEVPMDYEDDEIDSDY